MIWWLWTALAGDDPDRVHVFDCDPESDDLAWLGEGGWCFRTDNMEIGLRSAT